MVNKQALMASDRMKKSRFPIGTGDGEMLPSKFGWLSR